jgi:hypothetical protein
VLVEFAMISLVLYLLLAAVLEFGRALFAAQILQQATDVFAREVARTPGLPATGATLADALANPQFNQKVKQTIFDVDLLVVDAGLLQPDENLIHYFQRTDAPSVNKLLAPLMTYDRANGVYRYPGRYDASAGHSSIGAKVTIPVVSYSTGSEVYLSDVDVIEEITSGNGDHPFAINPSSSSPLGGGIVAVRFNYPFQAATLSAFAPNPSGISGPQVNKIIRAPGIAVGETPGPYSGADGLGQQLAYQNQGSNTAAVRPFRRLVSTQAIFRREVYGP